jgi:four helix bundle protein
MDALSELEVWKRSKDLSVMIYTVLSKCKDYGFKDQITRSSVSVPANIAEGYERQSKKGFAHYLKIAKGSCAELRTQIIIGSDIGYIEKADAKKLIDESLQISKMLSGLIKHCQKI